MSIWKRVRHGRPPRLEPEVPESPFAFPEGVVPLKPPGRDHQWHLRFATNRTTPGIPFAADLYAISMLGDVSVEVAKLTGEFAKFAAEAAQDVSE